MRSHWHWRSTSGFAVASCVLFVCITWPFAAIAQELVVNVPAHCGDAASFAVRVDGLAGQGSAARAEARVEVRAEAQGFRLEVRLPSGRRSSRHRDCRVLVDAAALIVALSVNPLLPLEPPVPAPAPAAPLARPEPTIDTRAEPWSLLLHADAGLAFGILPALGVPVAVGLRLERSTWGFGAGIRYLPPRESEGAPRVRVQAAGGHLLAHYLPRPWLLIGAGVAADLLHGRGTLVPDARSDVTSRLAGKLELAGRLPVAARQALSITGSVEATLLRGAFVVERYGAVFTPGMIAFSLGLRWELTIL